MRRPLLNVFIFLLLCMTVYVSMLLYANFNADSSRSDIKGWQAEKIIPDAESRQESFTGIQRALSVDPDNPEYLEIEAVLYRYRAFSFPADSERAKLANREALERYQHLLSLRPSWAPYWASIINIKYDLWEFDELMATALHNAARLGPWSSSTQQILLRAGFHGWPFLDIETREVINQALERAMQLQPKETIRLALDYGFGTRLSPYLEQDEMLKGLYEKELKNLKERLKAKD